RVDHGVELAARGRQVAADDKLWRPAAQVVEGGAELRRVDVVHPRTVDRGPQKLRGAHVVAGDIADVVNSCGVDGRERRTEAIGAETRAGLVVVEAGGHGTVEQRRPKRMQLAVTEIERLAWVEQEHAVHGYFELDGQIADRGERADQSRLR